MEVSRQLSLAGEYFSAKNGDKLNPFSFKPHYKPLRLSLYFPLPANKKNEVRFATHYLSELGLGEPLFKDSLKAR